MTPEDKQLLLIDLCTRLPYGVRIQVKEWTTVDTELKVGHIDRLQYDEIYLKPYLRPMSSMTEEESKEFAMLQTDFYSDGWLYPIAAVNMVNWLNKNHFDYRGLIEKGLAIEAPKGMYEINKE